MFRLGALIALLVSLCALWAYRFQRVAGLPVWRLAELKAAAPAVPGLEWTGAPDSPKLRLRVDAAHPRVAARIAIPGVPALEMLHLRLRLTAHGLTPGAELWEDGRVMIEWHAADGHAPPETDPAGSIRLDDQGGLDAFVLRPSQGPAVPALRVEHLGRAGEFEISELEITPVEERRIWKVGRWFLAFGWLAWVAACVRSWPETRWQGVLCASALWVALGIHFVVPGPWKSQRALYPDFQLGPPAAGSLLPPQPGDGQTMAASPPGFIPGATEPLGKLPEQGSLVLKIKYLLAFARPLLHALLLFAPTLAFALLVGRRPALFLSIMLALAIETAQTSFGYGFGWDDVLDLVTDAIGIALGIWAWRKISRRCERGRSAE